MYQWKKSYKVTYSLFLVLLLLFWELMLYPAGIGITDDIVVVGAQGIGAEEAYITGTEAVIQETNIPEMVSSYTQEFSTAHIFSGRTFHGRNAFGRFLWAVFMLLLLAGERAASFKYGLFQHLEARCLNLLLSFIHDQDGKKKIH